MANVVNTPPDAENEPTEAPAFPTNMKDTAAIYEYARHRVADTEQVDKDLAALKKACEEESADDSYITELACKIAVSGPMCWVRKKFGKLGKTSQRIARTVLPLHCMVLNKAGFIEYKSDREMTEEQIRERDSKKIHFAKKVAKLGEAAAKLSKHPKLQFLELAGPFIEPVAEALDTVDSGVANMRKNVLARIREYEAQQQNIESISDVTQHRVAKVIPIRRAKTGRNGPANDQHTKVA